MKKKSRSILIILIIYTIIYLIDFCINIPSIVKSDIGILYILKLLISSVCFIAIPIYYFFEEYRDKSSNFLNSLLILSALLPATITTLSFLKNLLSSNLLFISIIGLLADVTYLLCLINLLHRENFKYNNLLSILTIILFIFESFIVVKTIELYSLFNIILGMLQLIIKTMIILYLKNREQ